MPEASQYLVLDIETVPDRSLWQPPPQHHAQQGANPAQATSSSPEPDANRVPGAGRSPGAGPRSSQAAFPPPYAHQVIVVGCMLLDADYRLLKLGLLPESGGDETEIIQSFSSFVEDVRPALVTYNGRSFDLPVLALRSLRCGVPMAWYYKERGLRHRYSEEGHIDLCDWLADHGASRASSLDALARLIGLPGKIGIDGSQVHSLYQAGRIEEIRNYCLADVAQTALLFLRFRLLQGVLDSSQYRQAVAELTASLSRDKRLHSLTSAIDETRLLSAA